MEIYQLRSFVTVAREKHLTRAAEKLNVSQPAASAHIKALEEELGLALFHRKPTGMQLTAAGIPLYQKAKQILQQTNEFAQLGETLVNQPTGTIRIGLNRDAEFLRIRPLYQRLHSNYQDLEILLHQSISGTILRLIRSDELDCGFVLGRCDGEDINLLDLLQFKLNVVGPVDLREKIEGADKAGLATLPWIGLPADCPYSRIMELHFHAFGYHPQTEGVADGQSAITSMIESGVGLNFMVEEEALQAEKQGRVAIWPGESFPIGLFFAYRAKDEQSIQLQAVKTAIIAIWHRTESLSSQGSC